MDAEPSPGGPVGCTFPDSSCLLLVASVSQPCPLCPSQNHKPLGWRDLRREAIWPSPLSLRPETQKPGGCKTQDWTLLPVLLLAANGGSSCSLLSPYWMLILELSAQCGVLHGAHNSLSGSHCVPHFTDETGVPVGHTQIHGGLTPKFIVIVTDVPLNFHNSHQPPPVPVAFLPVCH